MPSSFASSARAALVSSACARDSSVFGPTMNTSGRSLPMVISPTATWRGVMVGCSHQARLVERSADKRSEQWVRLKRLRFQLGMELYADEPRVVGEFDDFRQHAVRRHA